MLFLGDIASPTVEHSKNLKKIFEDNNAVFADKAILFNLEGMIADDIALEANTPVLFNHSSVLDSFDKNAVLIAALANNHMLDLPSYYSNTMDALEQKNVHYLGIGKSKEEASNSISVSIEDNNVFIINACWSFLLYHQKNPSGGVFVNEINIRHIFDEVKTIKAKHESPKIVIYFHWSFDLEILPFPMYRQLSMDLIDMGVNLVIGTHSHCVQGGEAYKDGYIVYGLGNFYLPSNVFAGGKLSFPEMSKRQLVLEWDIKTNFAQCHWFDYLKDTNTLQFIESTEFKTSNELKKYSEYQGLSHNSYIKYFKKNRRKKVAIPLFKNYKHTFINSISMVLLKFRAQIARKLAEKGIIKWQN